jgi:ribokinase
MSLHDSSHHEQSQENFDIEVKPKIIVIGSCVIDITLLTENIPRVGESIVASKILTQVGGKASNQAIAISRLGGHAFLLTKLGNDQWASIALKLWESERVDISGIRQDNTQTTGMGIVVIDKNGMNITLSSIGANKYLDAFDVKNIMSIAKEAKVLSVHLNASLDVIGYALREARARGMTTILNASPPENLPAELYEATDIFIVNNIEASFYSGIEVLTPKQGLQAGRKIINQGTGVAIITFGENGLVLVTKSEQHFIPAFKVKAVDTVGAGDIFAAGLAVALAEGNDTFSAARFASVASALHVSRRGTLTSIPYKKDVINFLAREAHLDSAI